MCTLTCCRGRLIFFLLLENGGGLILFLLPENPIGVHIDLLWGGSKIIN